MSTLTFWLGFFAGFSTLTILILTIAASRKPTKELKEYHDEVLRRMIERNDIDGGIAHHLDRIASRYEKENP